MRHAHRRAYLVVAMSASALVTALLVASIARGSVLGARRQPQVNRLSRQLPTLIQRARLKAPVVPSWLGSVLLISLALGIVLLIVVARGTRRRPAEPPPDEQEDEIGEGDWAALISVELATASAEQLSRVRHGSPRNAIVVCWMRLQEATQRAGLTAQASETSYEFTVRAMRRLSLDDASITTLSELYREARFSDHPLVEAHRVQAISALEVLAGQLNRGGTNPLAVGSSMDIVSA